MSFLSRKTANEQKIENDYGDFSGSLLDSETPVNYAKSQPVNAFKLAIIICMQVFYKNERINKGKLPKNADKGAISIFTTIFQDTVLIEQVKESLTHEYTLSQSQSGGSKVNIRKTKKTKKTNTTKK